MKTVYLETSIFSFYYDEREQPNIVARRNWTVDFWEACRQKYLFVTSPAVLVELGRGNKPQKDRAFQLARSLPAVDLLPEIKQIAAIYVKQFVMPRDPLGDALHLAAASFHKCEFLATWNCRHLANANKADHIRRVNNDLNLRTPAMVTPMELLEVGID